jgi:hypothetical protein
LGFGGAEAAPPVHVFPLQALHPEGPSSRLELPALALSPEGAPLVAYYSEEYHLYLKNLDTGASRLVYRPETPRTQPATTAWECLGRDCYLLWRPKVGGKKYVSLQASHDGGKTFGPVRTLNREKAALLPVLMKATPEGRVAVLWLDERTRDRKFYLNLSTDRGETFLAEDLPVTEGYDKVAAPALLVEGGEIGVFFSGAVPAGEKHGQRIRQNYLVAKWSSDGGKRWQEARVAPLEEEMAVSLTAVRQGRRTLLFWTQGFEGIFGAYSDDGLRWTPIAFPETRGLDVGSLEAASAPNGMLYLASFARKEGALDKTQVYFQRSEDGGATWSSPRRINTNKHLLTHSVAPKMAADGEGTVVLVWFDFRNIRSNIYLNYSRDHGKTWLAEDVCLEEPGRFSSRFPRILRRPDGRYAIVFLRYRDDLFERADLMAMDVALPLRDAGSRGSQD